MPIYQLDLLFRKQHGIATRPQVLSTGVTINELDYLVRTKKLLVVHRNVYRASGAPFTPIARIQAAVLAAGPNAVASHTSALLLHGLPAFGQSVPHVSIGKGDNKRPGIAFHRARLPSNHLTTIERVRTTSAARACIDSASILKPHQLKELLNEAVISRKTTYRQIDSMINVLGTQGRRGMTTLKKILADNLDLAESTSALAPRFLRAVRGLKLEQPFLEHHVVINDRDYWLDAAWPEERIAVELDDYRSHGTSRKRFDHDRRRNNDLLGEAWRVVHITSAMDLKEISSTLKPLFNKNRRSQVG